jgi:hypothetical protein
MLPRARPKREERLLTSRQAAERLGVKLETLARSTRTATPGHLLEEG